MTVSEALQQRFSCRAFLPDPVEKKVLDEIFTDAFRKLPAVGHLCGGQRGVRADCPGNV